MTCFVWRDSDGEVFFQVTGSKLSVSLQDIFVVKTHVVPSVCPLELIAAPPVQDLPYGGVKLCVHVGEEGVLEEASSSSNW